MGQLIGCGGFKEHRVRTLLLIVAVGGATRNPCECSSCHSLLMILRCLRRPLHMRQLYRMVLQTPSNSTEGRAVSHIKPFYFVCLQRLVVLTKATRILVSADTANGMSVRLGCLLD